MHLHPRLFLKTAIVVLAAVTWSFVLAAPAHADGCAWWADLKPWFPPGTTPVMDEEDHVEACNHPPAMYCPGGFVNERRKWTVYLFPAYSYAHLLALQDDICFYGGAAGTAVVDKDYARGAYYFVLNVGQCAHPSIQTDAYAAVSFDTYVRVNGDATAQMAGLTRVVGCNTGLDVIAKAGCEVGMASDEAVGSIEFSFGPATIKIPIKYGGESDYETDGDANLGLMHAPVVDEEWMILNHVDGRVTADGDLLVAWADARAILMNHSVLLVTVCQCKGECKHAIAVGVLIDDTSERVVETEWTEDADTGRLKLPGEE